MAKEKEERQARLEERKKKRLEQSASENGPTSNPEAPTTTTAGTEKDNFNCSFYLKTGSCRYGDRCGKHHPYPTISETILFKNMYIGLGQDQVLDEDTDDNLMVTFFFFENFSD